MSYRDQNWRGEDFNRDRDGQDWNRNPGSREGQGGQNYGSGSGSQGQYGQGGEWPQRQSGPYARESNRGGSEWNRMGRYGDEGGQGHWSQGHSSGAARNSGDRNFGQTGGFGGSWGGYGGGSGGMGDQTRQGGFGGAPFVGESSYGAPRYGQSQTDGSGNWASSRGDWGSSGQQGNERGFFERAGDEVSSWFGDRDAERRREMDQHRGRGPKGYTRSDDRIREDVNDRLTDDGWLDASDIEVQVSSGEVTLTGQVNDRNAKRRAEDLAEAVSGVKHVQNNLRVKSADSSSMSAASGKAGSSGTAGSSASGSSTRSGNLT